MVRPSILAAGIVKDILFATIEDLDRYIEKLEFNGISYREVERYHHSTGAWILRIVTQYNNSELIEL